MAPNKNTKRHRHIGITLVVLNCMTFLIAIAVMALGTPPPGTVTITSPGPNTLIQSPNFTVTGTATPNKQILVYLNNAFVGQTISNNDGSWNIDVTGVKNGQINLYAKISEDPFLYTTHTAGPKTFTQIDTATNQVTSTIPGGIKQPRQIIHHPTQPRAYIFSSGTATIKVINSDTYETIHDITDINSNTTKIILTPDGNKLIVANYGIGGNIKIFDAINYNLLTTLNGDAQDIVISPDGSKLFATTWAVNIKSWKMSDFSPLPDIYVSAAADKIAINPSGTKLYLTEPGANQVQVVTLTSSTVTNTIAMPDEQPQRIVVSPAGDIAVIEANTQKILNLTTESISANLGGSGLYQGQVVFNSTGSTAYYGNNDIKVIDVASNTIVGTINKNGYGGLVVSPDNTKLYAGIYQGNGINVIDADTAPYNVLQTKEYPQLEYFAELTADGTKIYASSLNTGKIFVVNTINNSIEATIDSDQLYGCHPAQTALNKSETKLFVASSECAVLFIINTETNQLLNYVPLPDGSNFLTFNHDGSKLYIAEKQNIVIYDTATSAITDTIDIGTNPAFAMAITPDGNKLYISDPGNNRIVAFNTTTKTVVANIPIEDDAYAMAVNPAGTIVYASTPMTNHYTKISTVSDTVIGTPISTDPFPTSINFLPDGSKMYVVTGQGQVNIIDPSTDTRLSNIAISSGAFIFNSGLLRNRVISTATQDIFINTPELGQLQNVPPGYKPAANIQSTSPSDSSAGRLNLTPAGGNEQTTGQATSGVSSSQNNNPNSSNFFTNLPNNLIEAIKATPASVARVFPWVLFTLLLGMAAILMLQVFLEYRNIQRTIILANKERSLRAEKKTFLELSAHYLRTPLSIIQSGLELINFKNKKHEADGALNISKLLGGEIENILQKLQEEKTTEPKLNQVEFSSTGMRVLAAPAFLIPAILIGIISIIANILFINIAKLDLGVINLITQAMFFIVAVTVFYFVVRTFMTSRARQRAAKSLLEEEKELSHSRNQLIIDTHQILSEQLQHLSASIGAIKIKDQKPLQDVAGGIKSFEETLSKFELAAELESGLPQLHHNQQVNVAKLVDKAIKEYSAEQTKKELRIDTKIPSFGNVTTDPKSLQYIISTLVDNAIKFSPKKSIVTVTGNRTSAGYKLTVADQGHGINKGQLQQLFKPFSRVDNAQVFEKQGMGLSLYLDRLIVQSLGGKIGVDSAAGKGTRVTLLLP